MSPNPFQPPTADVADVPRPSAPRPRAVRLACQLVLASLALGLVTLLPGVEMRRPDDPQVPWFITVALVAVFGGITVWLVRSIHDRRNWARWALLGYLALGWFLTVGELSTGFEHSPLGAVLNTVCLGMEAVAAWLLFTGQGAGWFGGRRA